MKFKGPMIFAFIFLSIFLISSASACLVVNAKTVDSYIAEIPSIDAQLATCTVNIQSSIQSLVGNGDILVTVGSSKQFYGTITNKKLTGMTVGKPANYGYEILMSEVTFNALLASTDVFNDVLRGINNKDITIKPNGIWNSVVWFFASWFLPSPGPIPSPYPNPNSTANTGGGAGGGGVNVNIPAGPTGKPDYCDDTYLPGHQGYAQNQALWDGYSSDTDKVCQSQYGRGTPSPCIHIIQLSVSGNPYYLCWYNE